MTLVEFEKLLLLHGSDFARWPIATVDAARRLVETDASARALVVEMASVDRSVIAALTVEPAGSAVIGQILAQAAPTRSSFGTNLAAWRLPGIAAALAASFAGFAIGYFENTSPPIDDAMNLETRLGTGDIDIWSLL